MKTCEPANHRSQAAVQAARRFASLHPEWLQSSSPRFPEATFAWLRGAELLAAPSPCRLGGLGLDLGASRTLDLLQILKFVGYGDLSTGRLYEGHVNALQLINQFGTPAQIETAAVDVRERGMLFAVWNTDDSHAVRLLPQDNCFLIEGAKAFASGRERIERPLITAALPDGRRQMIVVPVEEAQLRVERGWWNPIGMEASESVRVDFSGTKIGLSALIGGVDDYLRQPWFFGGAIRFAAVQLGGAEALFDETRGHLQRLERTSDPYQRQRAGQAAILIESGNQWLRSAAELFDNVGVDRLSEYAEQIVAYVHLVRSAIERICLEVLELCIRAVGAQGLARGGRFQQIVRDLNLYLRQPAPDAALAGAGAYVLDSPADLADLWSSPPCDGEVDQL